jgi:K+-transporting ATPase ATPase A chain
MTATGWLQLGIYLALLLAITKPLGIYLVQVLDPESAGNSRGTGGTFMGRVLGPVERLIYKALRVDPKNEQTWIGYSVGLLLFSLVTMLLTYGMLRLQQKLPGQALLNPQGFAGLPDHLALNTAASFTTNTNWQSYTPESTMSYLSQMVALVIHNFFSAAVGIAVAAALVRGIARSSARTVGNFWRDLVRIHLYLLLPICTLFAVVMVSQGMIQNFKPYTKLNVVDQAGAADAAHPNTQTIAQGPVASQVAIKMLGTNGGGFFNANASHPFENPTPLIDFLQILSIFVIPSALTYYLGRMVKQQGHGWAVWGAMCFLFLAGTIVLWHAETAGNPRLAALGVDPTSGNYEGKEVRFGLFQSALFACVTTDASCGAVNCMHDSLTPLGGFVPMFNMHMGEVVFGGVGAGLYGMLVFVIVAIFIAGLMVGRTPEYLGKKIEAFDVKAAVLGVLAPSLAILAFSAWAVVATWGQAGTNNAGPHGFSEIHYAYASGAANNGSAFAGLTATPANGDRHYNLTLTADMLIGRFFIIIPVLALAGHLAGKKRVTQSAGSFPVNGFTFGVLLVGTVIVVGALTFLPALALGPIVEHFQMWGAPVTY